MKLSLQAQAFEQGKAIGSLIIAATFSSLSTEHFDKKIKPLVLMYCPNGKELPY